MPRNRKDILKLVELCNENQALFKKVFFDKSLMHSKAEPLNEEIQGSRIGVAVAKFFTKEKELSGDDQRMYDAIKTILPHPLRSDEIVGIDADFELLKTDRSDVAKSRIVATIAFAQKRAEQATVTKERGDDLLSRTLNAVGLIDGVETSKLGNPFAVGTTVYPSKKRPPPIPAGVDPYQDPIRGVVDSTITAAAAANVAPPIPKLALPPPPPVAPPPPPPRGTPQAVASEATQIGGAINDTLAKQATNQRAKLKTSTQNITQGPKAPSELERKLAARRAKEGLEI